MNTPTGHTDSTIGCINGLSLSTSKERCNSQYDCNGFWFYTSQQRTCFKTSWTDRNTGSYTNSYTVTSGQFYDRTSAVGTWLGIKENAIYFQAGNSGSDFTKRVNVSVPLTSVVTDGRVHEIAVAIFSSNHTAKMYFDGNLVGESQSAESFSNDDGSLPNHWTGGDPGGFLRAKGWFFEDGQDPPEESGSNPTNDIIEMETPTHSSYVLRQSTTSTGTEYQLNLGSELLPSSTYVMKGWYATSADYNGADRMFHARAFSAGGSHIATNDGIGTLLYSREINGLTWEYRYETINTPSDYDDDGSADGFGGFQWYLGYGATSGHSGYRYYAGLQIHRIDSMVLPSASWPGYTCPSGWSMFEGKYCSRLGFGSAVYNNAQYRCFLPGHGPTRNDVLYSACADLHVGTLRLFARDIVKDGLVFQLDSGDLDSYPGSGNAWTDLASESRWGAKARR